MDLLTGVNFASAGSGYDPETAKLLAIYAVGARVIGILGVLPSGCFPFERTLHGGIGRACYDTENQAAVLFNSKLRTLIDSLNVRLPEAKVIYLDIYTTFLSLIQNPAQYGFEVVDKGCCGTGNLEFGPLCNKLSTVTALPTNETTRAVFAFGDSIFDTGNNDYIISLAKSNFPPYGRDFVGGKPTGRFCNGKLPSDFVAEKYGVKKILPAYLDPNLQLQDILTGVCFASAGSGYDPLTPKLLSVLSLPDQLGMFRKYKSKISAAVGNERTATILSKSISFVSMGSNDFAINYFSTPLRSPHYDIPAYTDLMIQSALTFLQELYALGARVIGILSVPPIGCLPALRTLDGGIEKACYETANQAAILFNSKLSHLINSLNERLPEAHFIYIENYSPLLSLLQNPAQYGFEVVDKGCCGTGNLEFGPLCNKASPGTCTDVSKYLFWDSFHPTEKAYRILSSISLKDIKI
ncbi:hypothetical protein ACLB2K_000953 [Fragaria x ananassa]